MSERPRVGFLGTGWIGRHRLEAMLATGAIEVAAIADPSAEMRSAAIEVALGAAPVDGLPELLAMDLDGIVIASPSALHAQQSIQALEHGVAVFCQKPLGRTAAEVRAVVDAARAANRLLGVDLSYRFTSGMQAIRDLIRSGQLGRPFAADLVFHNAYGPDKPWFYDPALSGGGCVMDLGVHLIDLALWAFDFPRVADVQSSLYAGGSLLEDPARQVEDYAVATLALANGAVVRVACSWDLPAGCEAVISAEFYGTGGGAALRNEGGSFVDFTARRLTGTGSEELVAPESDWGGRAAADWARRLAAGERFDPSADRLIDVAEVLDRIYGR
ncbi:MAG: Gfo/Idh/MocA family protein [Sphingomicrobium sp.]